MVDKLVEELLDAATPDQIERANAAVEANLIDGSPRYESSQGYACALTAIIEGDAIAQKRVNELEAALKQIASGEVGGDPDEPFSGYMRCRKIALDALALPTPEVPGESEEEMK